MIYELPIMFDALDAVTSRSLEMQPYPYKFVRESTQDGIVVYRVSFLNVIGTIELRAIDDSKTLLEATEGSYHFALVLESLRNEILFNGHSIPDDWLEE